MKNISKHIILAFVALLVSCNQEKATPKVSYDTNAMAKPVAKTDTSSIKVADLPINFTGTNILIHPIGDLSIYSRDKNVAYDSSSYKSESQQSFTVSDNNQYEITGYLQNIKFQEIGKDSIKSLTNKKILIETATYLKNTADKTKKQFLVYTLTDADTNKDGITNSNDIKSLYISAINGDNFTKLSQDFQELINWNCMESTSRLYFRTIEDINKNGAFDKEDKVHYHYLDLLSKEWKAQEYFPVN
ncbi:hypothetical protein [Flavobacterium sp.]|uniref:hypothetical protein n=1 Tax=Flavobacterium sp. TaxID=239 RepID=UPI003BC8CFAA